MKAIFAFLCCIPILSISQEPFQRITFGPYMFSCDGADVGVNCYIATGELLVLGGIKEIMTIKVNEQGEIIWYNLYGGNNNDDERSYSICETSDSNYIIAGYTATYGYGSSDIYLLRIDRFGNLRWARTSHGGQTSATNLDNWEISVAIDSMLCLPVSVPEYHTMNFAIFPNPANDHVTVCYPDIFRNDLKEITFYNNLGSSVKQIISTENITEALVYIGDLPAGIYFAVLSVEGRKVGTGKVAVR